MPLIKSNSKPAFKQNVSEMIKAGHPQNQALAAAYNIKNKYALGGDVNDKMMSDLMKRRKEAKDGFNTEPDLRESSSSLSNSTLFDDLAGTEQGRPDAEESMYAKGGIAYESNLKEDEGSDPELIHNEEAYDTGGPVLPGAQSAQDSMRKAFKFAEGGKADPKIPQARSYVQYGDLMHDKDGNDIPHHDSLPQGSGKEDAFYKPKAIGNQGRPSIDLNMYAPGGKVKMAYGQGRTEEDQTDTPQTYADEVSTHAYAQGGTVEQARHLAPNDTDTAEEKNESTYSEPPADNGLDKNPKDQAYDHQAFAEGGIAYSNKSEFETDDAPLEHNEENYSEPVGDYGPDKDPSDQAYYADGGPVQTGDHNPKSGEEESPKAKRKRLMIESLNS